MSLWKVVGDITDICFSEGGMTEERYNLLFAAKYMGITLNIEQIKLFRLNDVNFPLLCNEINKLIAGFSIVKMGVFRNNKWEAFHSGLLFLTDSMKNLEFVLMEIVPGGTNYDLGYTPLFACSVFDSIQCKQISKFEVFEDVGILRTLKNGVFETYCIFFPNLNPSKSFLRKYQDAFQFKDFQMKEIRARLRKKRRKKRNLIDNRCILDDLKISNSPIKMLSSNSEYFVRSDSVFWGNRKLKDIKVREFKKQLTNEWKVFISESLELKLTRKGGNECILFGVNRAIKKFCGKGKNKKYNYLPIQKPPKKDSEEAESFLKLVKKISKEFVVEELGGWF